MPAGTPVFDASGYPHADGWGKQVLAGAGIVGRGGGATGGPAVCVGLAGVVGRTTCDGVPDACDVDDRLGLAVELVVELDVALSAADEDPCTDGLADGVSADDCDDDGEVDDADGWFGFGPLLAMTAARLAIATSTITSDTPSTLRLRNIDRWGAGVDVATKAPKAQCHIGIGVNASLVRVRSCASVQLVRHKNLCDFNQRSACDGMTGA
jgi:hypothetical protein